VQRTADIRRIPHHVARPWLDLVVVDASAEVVLACIADDRARNRETHLPQLALVREDGAFSERSRSPHVAIVAAATWNISSRHLARFRDHGAQAHAGEDEHVVRLADDVPAPAMLDVVERAAGRDDRATSVHSMASAGEHSTLLLGLLSGRMIGCSTCSAIARIISSVNVPRARWLPPGS